MPAGQSVVVGSDEIPYQPAALAQKRTNSRTARRPIRCEVLHAGRAADHVHRLSVPDLPDAGARRDHVRMVAASIGSSTPTAAAHVDGIEFWMGDSRGRWEGDTLVVDVTNHNDRTWFDMAGNFHSEALHVMSATRCVDAEHDPLRGHGRGSEGVHAAVEDQHAAAPAERT